MCIMDIALSMGVRRRLAAEYERTPQFVTVTTGGAPAASRILRSGVFRPPGTPAPDDHEEAAVQEEKSERGHKSPGVVDPPPVPPQQDGKTQYSNHQAEHDMRQRRGVPPPVTGKEQSRAEETGEPANVGEQREEQRAFHPPADHVRQLVPREIEQTGESTVEQIGRRQAAQQTVQTTMITGENRQGCEADENAIQVPAGRTIRSRRRPGARRRYICSLYQSTSS